MTYRTFDGTSQTETIVDGRFSSSGDIALSDGSATQGAIYFADDKNTGIYSPQNDGIAFTIGGKNKFQVTEPGNVVITSTEHDKGLEILAEGVNKESRIRIQGKSSGGTSHDWYLSSSRGSDTFNIHNGTTSWLTIADDGDTTFAGDVKIHKSGDASLNIRDTSANAVSNWIEVDSSDGLAIYNCYREGVGTAYPHVFKGYTTEYARIDAAGIKFNGDTASANGLDDYEEGTFGLDLSGSGGSITEGGDDKLSYTKIGRQVFISGRIYISAISSPTGDLTLSGLPFPNQAADETSEKAYLAVIPHNWTYDADGLWWEISAGASNGPVQRQKTGVIHGNKLAASAVIAGSYLVITGSYHSSV